MPEDRTGATRLAPFPQDLPTLTALRFWLALGVVVFHYSLAWPHDDRAVTGLIERARLGVDVFFILSGFILTHVYAGPRRSPTLDYGRFLAARLARIYPAHLVILAFATAVVGAGALSGASFEQGNYNLAGWWRTLTLTHAWTPTGRTFEWNGPTWSLSAEWFAYLAFPVFAWIGLKLHRRPGVLLALAGGLFLAFDLAYRAAFGQALTHAEFNLGIARIVPEFLYGIALYRLGEQLAPSPRAARACAAASALAMLGLMHAGADERSIVAVSGGLVLSLALLSKAGAGQTLARPWMLLAGEASYALYVAHFPLILAWNGMVEMFGLRGDAPPFAWPETAALLMLTMGAALALHLWIERPARDLARDWMGRRAAAA